MSGYIADIYSNKIFHWMMFIKYNNLGFLRLESLNLQPHKVEQDNSEDAKEAYHNINDQVIQEFGIEESFIDNQRKKEDIALLKLNFIISGKKSLRTAWRIKELDLIPIKEGDDIQMDLSEEIMRVSKNIGVPPINIKEFTIHQYLMSKKS